MIIEDKIKERVVLLEHQIALLNRCMTRNEKDIWAYIAKLERAIKDKKELNGDKIK